LVGQIKPGVLVIDSGYPPPVFSISCELRVQLNLAYKFSPSLIETCAAPSPLTSNVDMEKEKNQIDAIQNYTYIR